MYEPKTDHYNILKKARWILVMHTNSNRIRHLQGVEKKMANYSHLYCIIDVKSNAAQIAEDTRGWEVCAYV